MAASNSNPTYTAPVIVYSARDFPSIRAATIAYLKSQYPTRWQDFSASNFGIPLIEVDAYQNAILSWNLDTEISETFLATAKLKDSVLTLAGNVGYVPVGRTASIVLADATMLTAPNTVPAVLPAGTQINSLQGQLFEVLQDCTIQPGQTSPTVAVATQADTAPQGLLLDFIAGETDVTFHLGSSAGRQSLNVEAGMWLASQGQYPQWYQIASLDTNKTTFTLGQPWNSVFTGSFVIKSAGSDAASSRTFVSAVPFGTFNAVATATLNSTTVTFTTALPQTVLPNQYFRMNGLTSCCGSAWFQISGVASDRLSITLATAFGPSTPHGFDDLNVGFNVQNRSVILINGSSRADQFPTTTDPVTQSFRLLSSPVIPSSVQVYDQSGLTNPDGSLLAWNRVNNLNEATFNSTSFRSYQLVEVEEDIYEIRFGNGILGQQPVGVVTVNYRVGGGPEGNVPVNSFNSIASGQRGNDTVSIRISNANSYGQGGAYGEDVPSLKANIPTFYSTNSRGVTAEDYQSLVLQNYPLWSNATGSIAQATVNQALNAIQYGGNVIYVNTWTTTQWTPPSAAIPGTLYSTLTPPSAALIANVNTFLDGYAMMTDKPTVLQGEVDEAIVTVDLQIGPTYDNVQTRVAAEQEIMDLFNSQSVVDGNPLLLSDVYGVLEAIPGVLGVRMRELYLDYMDPNQPGDLQVTPVSLQTIGDLYPRGLNSIVTPGDIQVLAWSVNIGLALFINAVLYPNVSLAEEEIRNTIEKLFYDLRPGDGITIAQIQEEISLTQAGQVNTATPVVVASNINLDITNAQALSVLNIDGVNLSVGDRFLLFGQTDASQNGVYVVGGMAIANAPWTVARAVDLDDYNTLSPGTLISVTGGVTYIGLQFFYNTHNLNYNSWEAGTKTFTVGNLLDAQASLIAIQQLNSIRFDAPIGNTPTSKAPLPSTMYYCQSLTISAVAGTNT